MSISGAVLYNTDGLIRGSYVYMLLCRDGNGPVYVKVGVTDHPDQRLESLRRGCPVTPLQFHSMSIPNRRRALFIERRLHRALREWRQHGEWFIVPMDHKPRFNDAIKSALANLPSKWRQPLQWSRIAVQPLVRLAQRRHFAYIEMVRRRGQSFQDFQKDSIA